MNKFGVFNKELRYHHLLVSDDRGKGDHIWNKYLLSLDGGKEGWGKTTWILNSNSVLVK